MSRRLRHWPVLGLALLAAVGLASPPVPGAAGPDVPLAAYEQAAREGSTGVVTGRTVLTGRHPESLEEPLADVALTLVPRSEDLLTTLARLRRALRDEPEKYASSAEAVVAAQREYEQALTQAGGHGLV
ncbi:MAG TPA: hypothetical protein VNO23_18785, partial [Candidatus Binatia bacterium]|nr:hypothetical protein [Candidatus Binatia bacterium]